MLQVMDLGDGWKVYGEWYGTLRVVWTPTRADGRVETDPFMQVVMCNDYAWMADDMGRDAAKMEMV